jgi:hypothetical protein
MEGLFLEAAERMLVGLEVVAGKHHTADAGNVRVTQFVYNTKRDWHYLYQELGASINAITRERAVELLAAAKADSDAFSEREIGRMRHRG